VIRNHARTACVSRELSCLLGIGEEHYQAARTALDRTASERMSIDPDGRPRYFHRRRLEPSRGTKVELSILFRPREVPGPRPRPTGR
jgi:hypothetical protein